MKGVNLPFREFRKILNPSFGLRDRPPRAKFGSPASQCWIMRSRADGNSIPLAYSPRQEITQSMAKSVVLTDLVLSKAVKIISRGSHLQNWIIGSSLSGEDLILPVHLAEGGNHTLHRASIVPLLL